MRSFNTNAHGLDKTYNTLMREPGLQRVQRNLLGGMVAHFAYTGETLYSVTELPLFSTNVPFETGHLTSRIEFPSTIKDANFLSG